MSDPTNDQRAVLEDDSRIRVVRAVPGSGKTWLVAQLIRRELIQWESHHAGLAALSFTRVGGDEIRRAVGHELGHPHFVGTLDAFLFRYVIRPFARQLSPGFPSPRLIPADWEPHQWWQKSAQQFEVSVGTGKQRKTYNVFNACFLREEGTSIVLGYKSLRGSLEPLDGSIARDIFKKKREIWRTRGFLTHSDAAFVASKILNHSTYGGIVRRELLQRFPYLFIDELQDTGWFLGQSVLSLLEEPTVRAVLVGDPDQAIYEFNGARPDLFQRFTEVTDATTLTLDRSRRCPLPVCRIAKYFTNDNRRILPADDKNGRAILLTFESRDMELEIGRLRAWADSSLYGSNVKIISRKKSTVERIAQRVVQEAPKLESVPMNHFHRAVKNFLQGRQVPALVAVRAGLESAAFDCELATDEERLAREIDPVLWKQLCVGVLLEASRTIDNETFLDWGERTAQFTESHLRTSLPSAYNGKQMRRPRGSAKTELRQNFLPMVHVTSIHDRRTPVQTIHGVKGETHEVTIVVYPKPRRKDQCLSEIWWSSNVNDQEERRIAFVAFTRTMGDLILCMSEACHARMVESRPDFVREFHVATIADFVKCDGQLDTMPVDADRLRSQKEQ